MTRVSSHFLVEEFAQPARHGELALPYPARWIESRLVVLCADLETLRAYLGSRPITILSGYRSPAYNRAIDGAAHSQHCEGRAADLVVEGLAADDVVDAVEHLLTVGGFQRVRGVGVYTTFVHLDIRPSAQVVHWVGRRTLT